MTVLSRHFICRSIGNDRRKSVQQFDVHIWDFWEFTIICVECFVFNKRYILLHRQHIIRKE